MGGCEQGCPAGLHHKCAAHVGPLCCRSMSALKDAYGADAVTEAGLAILEQQFPAYARPALKQLLEAAGGDVSSALDSMCFLEAEQSTHCAATKPAKSQVHHCRCCTWVLRAVSGFCLLSLLTQTNVTHFILL